MKRFLSPAFEVFHGKSQPIQPEQSIEEISKQLHLTQYQADLTAA